MSCVCRSCLGHPAAAGTQNSPSVRSPVLPIQQKEVSVTLMSRLAFTAKPALWGYLHHPAPWQGVFLMSKFTQQPTVSQGVSRVGGFPFSILTYTGVTWCKLYLLSFVRMEGKGASLSPPLPAQVGRGLLGLSLHGWKRRMSCHFQQQMQAAGLEGFVPLQMLPDLSNQPDPCHL